METCLISNPPFTVSSLNFNLQNFKFEDAKFKFEDSIDASYLALPSIPPYSSSLLYMVAKMGSVTTTGRDLFVKKRVMDGSDTGWGQKKGE